ncbi:MAG: DUF6036 family nucleotidyltransferase [Candidatus Jordarchaeum sp.]|uniref:DUF6036 family nucleotidyltransferase n=1 Tax=Candidatus Jordarchaeum sp. TaxID=2823881 RepID=UPI0040490EB5
MFEFHEDFEELLKVFEKSNYDVYLIGARALILHGILHRTTKDIDVMVSVGDVEELRGKITEELRRKGFDVQWRSFGLSIKTSSSNRIDVNVPLIIYDSEFKKHSKKIRDNLYLPSIEDLIVTKLMAFGRRDYEDLKDILWRAEKIDYTRLCRRVREAGLLKEFNKLSKRLGTKQC